MTERTDRMRVLEDRCAALRKALHALLQRIDGWPPHPVRPPSVRLDGCRIVHSLGGYQRWHEGVWKLQPPNEDYSPVQIRDLAYRLNKTLSTPREWVVAIRQIDALIEWAEFRREGQIRHQREVERQQAHYVAQLEAEAAALELRR